MQAKDKAARWLEHINKKGWEVAQKLIEIKANQDINLEQLANQFTGKREIPPEDRLRFYLDQINHARERLGGDQWGVCLQCGSKLPDAMLDEMPWVELCQPCDAAIA